MLEALELPACEKAISSLQLPEGVVIVFEPVTHAAQFLDVKGEPTKERQALSLVFDRGHRHHETLVLHPGPLRIAVENHTNVRTLPSVCIANDALHDLLGRRRPRSEEHTSELQSLMRISYAVFCLKTKTIRQHIE